MHQHVSVINERYKQNEFLGNDWDQSAFGEGGIACKVAWFVFKEIFIISDGFGIAVFQRKFRSHVKPASEPTLSKDQDS